MKKKGFTLVELLAVIAILAILVIIALPNVLQMFNNAKKNAFSTEVRTIYKQAQSDYIADSLKSSGPKFYCDSPRGNMNGSSSEDCKKLNITTTKEYYIEMDSNGIVVYIGVKDKSFVFGSDAITSINDIHDNQILDYSKNTGFNVYNKTTSSDGVPDNVNSENVANYTVIHLQQKILDLPSGQEENDIYYNVVDTVTLSGVIGNVVSPSTNSYTGFTSPSRKNVVVTDDGTAVVKYYYTRNKYTLRIQSNTCAPVGVNTSYDCYYPTPNTISCPGGSSSAPGVCAVPVSAPTNFSGSYYYNQRITLTGSSGVELYLGEEYLGNSYAFNMGTEEIVFTSKKGE